MSLTVTVSGTTVVAEVANISIENTIDERSTASFSIYDAAGTSHYVRGQPVVFTDSTLGVLFSGYIIDSTETKLIPSSAIVSAITCNDQRYFADNHIYIGDEYVNTYAGDIVADIVSGYLVQDGITANVAVDHDNSQATFAAGTLTNTISTVTDLELTSSGTTFSKTETTTADFNTGTLNNVSGVNNTLSLNSSTVIKYTGTATANLGTNLFTYTEIYNTALTFNTGDQFIYDVFVSSLSPAITCGLDIGLTDGTYLKDIVDSDQNGLNVHPATNMSGYANDQWYHRIIQLTTANFDLTGKTLAQCNIAFEGDAAGTYTAYVRNATIQTSGGSVRATIFNGSLSLNKTISNQGYYGVKITTVKAYEDFGQRVSPAYSIASPGIIKNSIISWNAPAYSQTTASTSGNYPVPVKIETSFDAGATWQPCTNHMPIANILAGMNTSGKTVTLRQSLSLSGPDPTISPVLSDCAFSISPSYAMAKSDAVDTDVTSGDFSSGTLNNVQYNALTTSNPAGEQIAGVYRNWGQGDLTGTTVFGTVGSNPVAGIDSGRVIIRAGISSPPAEVKLRLDFAGQWQNFVAEMDIMHLDTSLNITYGLIYRTQLSAWTNATNTWGYCMQFESGSIALFKGTNGGGTGTTLCQRVSVPFLSNTTYHLKVLVNGSTHQAWVNDILYINTTDTAVSTTGYMGFDLLNGSSTRYSAFFNNFGVMNSSFTASRVHSSLSLNSLGGVENSIIQWMETIPGNTSLLIESSINGGSTYLPCTNGAVIPNLLPGASTSGVSLLVRETLTTQNANATPILSGITVLVVGNYNSTGTRVSPSTSLASVVRCGSSSVSWNALTPTNTSLVVQSSPDGTTWTTIGSNGGAISGITGQPDPIVDSFSVNTSANYTSTFASGGASATWTYDTANSRITASGGTKAQYIMTSPSAGDAIAIIDMDQSEKGGLIFHYTNNLNYYEVVIHDASSGTLPNTLQLFRVAAGVSTQIGTNQTISFTRGTYHRINMTYAVALITVSFDGTSLISTTDGSPLTTGTFGFWNDGSTSRYYQIWVEAMGTVLAGKSNYTKLILTSTDPTVTPQVFSLIAAVRGQGIDTGALQTLTSYRYQSTISSIFDDLANKSNYWWGITGGQVYFQNRPSQPSPFLLQSADILAGNSISLKNSSTYYRNRQYVLGGVDKTALITDNRTGDGFAQAWTLAYPVYIVTPTTPAPSILRNGVIATVGVSGVDSGMDFYYAVGNNVIAQDASADPLTPTDTLVISYYGQLAVIAVANNVAQQTALAAIQGGSGIVEVVETAAGTDSAGATTIANARLTAYGILSRQFNFATLRSGLAPGMLLGVFVPEHAIFDGQFLVTKVTTVPQMRGDGTILYQYNVESTDGPSLGGWTKFFVALGQTVPT